MIDNILRLSYISISDGPILLIPFPNGEGDTEKEEGLHPSSTLPHLYLLISPTFDIDDKRV